MNKNFEIQSQYFQNINSLKYDYSNKRFAICNNEGKIYIFSSDSNNQINKTPYCIYKNNNFLFFYL